MTDHERRPQKQEEDNRGFLARRELRHSLRLRLRRDRRRDRGCRRRRPCRRRRNGLPVLSALHLNGYPFWFGTRRLSSSLPRSTSVSFVGRNRSR